MLGAVVSLGGGAFACASCWPQKTSSLEEVESELNEIEELETYHTDLVPSETFEINQEVSADDLGITLPPSLDKFTTTLTIDDLDDHTGLVSVRLKLSHESRHIVRNFNVINFAKKPTTIAKQLKNGPSTWLVLTKRFTSKSCRAKVVKLVPPTLIKSV
ncbi:hypothetical protein [Mycoplasma sp. ATU-Cv-508]|uniref:hypothetical protein n=1 Tax=Mycoplasma sp. ATU-Cv-508 TaxID=2048001 RepID=UPI001375327E